MKKLGLMIIAASLLVVSCGTPKTATNQVNLTNTNPPISNVSVNNSTNILQTANTTPQSGSQVNTETLKQIEDQQRETSDPRKTVNKSGNTNNNQSTNKTSGNSKH